MDSEYVAPFDSELMNFIVIFPFALLQLSIDFVARICHTIISTISSVVFTAVYTGVRLHMQLLSASIKSALRLVFWLLPLLLSAVRFLLSCMAFAFSNWPASTSATLGIAAFIYIASNPRARRAVRARLTGLITTILASIARELDTFKEECLIAYGAWQRTRATPAKIPTSPPLSLPATLLNGNKATPPPPCSPYPFFTPQPSPPALPSPPSPPSPSRYERLQALEQHHWATKTGPYTDWARSYRPPSQRFPFAPAPSPPGSPPGSSPPGTPHPHPTSLFPPGHWLLDAMASTNSKANTLTNTNISTTTTTSTGLCVDFGASVPPPAALVGRPATTTAALASVLPGTPTPAANRAASAPAPSSVLAASASAVGSGTGSLGRAMPTFSWSAGGGGGRQQQQPGGAPVFATK